MTAWLRRLTEVEGGRWAWVREDYPAAPQAVPVPDRSDLEVRQAVGAQPGEATEVAVRRVLQSLRDRRDRWRRRAEAAGE